MVQRKVSEHAPGSKHLPQAKPCHKLLRETVVAVSAAHQAYVTCEPSCREKDTRGSGDL